MLLWTKVLLSRSSSYHCDLPFSKFMTIWPFTKWTSTYSTKIIHMINLKITFSDSFHLLMTDFESVIDFIYLFCRWFICHVTAPYVHCRVPLRIADISFMFQMEFVFQGPIVILSHSLTLMQCPKKVKGQFTIFQIIEHHTSLKDVTALKLMT